MVKREQVAWVLLMASFVALATVTIVFRDRLVGFLRSNTRPALMAEAQRLARDGRIEEAERAYADLARHYPHREDVLLVAARFADGQGQDARAEDLYRLAAAFGRHGPIQSYASFLDSRGRGEEALALYRQYVADHPSDRNAQLLLGLRLQSRGELEACRSHLLAAARDSKMQFSALTALGQAYRDSGMTEDAIGTWRDLVAGGGSPARQVYWQDIALAYAELGRWAEAVKAWQSYLALFPESLPGARGLAKAASETDDSAARTRAALLLRSLEPQERVDGELASWLSVDGFDPVAGENQVTVYLTFQDSVSKRGQCGLRLQLAREGDGGKPVTLATEPDSLGPVPFWRGESVRQRLAFALPADLPPGDYTLQIALGPKATNAVPLHSLKIGGEEPGDAAQ
ncbi:MAG: tetratricopeptide repeat protein [Nitrospiraceae bacterium]|nr:tetratricopeptide repeat protein [Nitrospiraceae bacterium]